MKRFLKIAAILALAAVPSFAGAEMYVVGSETAGVTTVARSLAAVPTNVHKVQITVRGGAISWFADGSTPTAANGNILSEGGAIELECQDEITKFKAIKASGETGVALSNGETGVSLYVHQLGNR